jgi:hypothetical protein
MNRHARRATKAHGPRAWRSGPPPAGEGAGQLYELIFADQAEVADMLLAADGGDERAGLIAHAATECVAATVAAARTTTPRLCLACPRELTDYRFSVALAVPGCDDPAKIICGALCHTCEATDDGSRERAMLAFRAVWPSLRPIRVTHPSGGHA